MDKAGSRTSELTLFKLNVGSEKDYCDIYKKFLESVVLPDSYTDKMCMSKDVHYSYSQGEIETSQYLLFAFQSVLIS